eukprot:TRINITY_DN1654_c5_g1_i1.p1 TRINITY_DN1654_c5_g1~~TRINITY_DN1654_c5_g1_i1.p1  ORF type:complete len:437 (+),score=47.09 TRINITY_DN1654_c5_g1_i1:79-1389(+)
MSASINASPDPNTKVIYSTSSTQGATKSSYTPTTTTTTTKSVPQVTTTSKATTTWSSAAPSTSSAARPASTTTSSTIVKKTTSVLSKNTATAAVSTTTSSTTPARQVVTSTSRATCQDNKSVVLNEVPFSSTSRVISSKTVDWRPRMSRSSSPNRKNYTPRRGRGGSAVQEAYSTLTLELPRKTEYRTYRYATGTTAATPANTVPILLSSPNQNKSKVRDTSGSIQYRGLSVATTDGRSASPGAPQMECRAVFMHQSRSWKFSLPADSSVNDAISTATQQVLRSVVDKDRRLGDKLSISVLPSVTDTSTVSEWSQRNLEQPPMIIIHSEQDDCDGLAQQKPEFDAQNMQRLMEEQTGLLTALQKQLGEQTAIIRNQATYISELQAKDRQQSTELSEVLNTIKSEMVQMKGQMLALEEHFTSGCNENHKKKAHSREK